MEITNSHSFKVYLRNLILVGISLIAFACSAGLTRESDIEEYILKLKEEGETAGMSVTVSKDNKILWSKGYGYGHLEQQTSVYPGQTKFRIGSISKALTSAAVGILMSEGRLDVDQPVQKYVPYFPEKRWTITTRQIAGHLAGIRHYNEGEFYSAKHYPTVAEGLEIFMNDTLLFEPGTQYAYSSYGYNLVSAVVEGASGIDFLTYMDSVVFKPLGMLNTVADQPDSIIYFRSGFYSMSEGKVINAPYVDNSYKWAGGGFLSTSEDLVKFGNAVLYAEFLPDSVIEELITSQTTSDGNLTDYGIGWISGVTETGRRYYGHGGGSVGGSCNLIIYPEEKLVLVVVTNDSRARVGKELHALAEMFLE